jgi:hypothetical protein
MTDSIVKKSNTTQAIQQHMVVLPSFQKLQNSPPKTVRAWLKGQATYTLHKPVSKRFTVRKYQVSGIEHQWQSDLAENEFDAMQYILQVTGELPQIDLQTMVATHWHPFKIKLHKLSDTIQPTPYYNAEHFPAVSITKNINPTHVNVFASGVITVCDVKDLQVAIDLQKTLDKDILACARW